MAMMYLEPAIFRIILSGRYQLSLHAQLGRAATDTFC